MKYKKNDEFEISITDLSDEGLGIGRTAGFTWFIKGALIGDRVLAAATKVKKSYGYARAVRIIEPSPDRISAPCPIASPCGGCQIQALSYPAQLKFKQKKVYNSLKRLGGFDIEEDFPEPIIGMDSPLRYRNKAAYPIGKSHDGRIIAGFYAGRTHSIIECGDCLIGAAENDAILRTIVSFMEEYHIEPYDEVRHTGTVRHVMIRKGFSTGEIMVCIVINANFLKEGCPSADAVLLSGLREVCPGLKSLVLCINTNRTNVILGNRLVNIFGPGYIEDIVGGIRFRISPLSFFQVNPAGMRKLYDTAVEYASLTGTENVLDLYCGVGTISLFMARHAARVCGVEIVPEAIENARENARINAIENAEFYVGSAGEFLPSWTASHGTHIDVIVVDPPRKGCDEKCLRTMLELSPSRIVYVSCNPATLARDLRYLAGGGYTLDRVRPCDMFPNTVHVETVVLMSIKDRKPDTHINVSQDMDDFHRIIGDEEEPLK